MYGLERALTDTGKATPPRKECIGTCPSWCRVISSSLGLIFKLPGLSSSVFTSPLSSTILKSYLSTDPIALSRAVVPIYTSFIWVSRNLDKQILLMQLGIKQLL